MSRAAVFGLLTLVLAFPAGYATDYTVGDSTGWDTSGDYVTWASGKTFKIGDKLLFVYGSSHQVDEVSKADYDSCTSTNPLSSNSDGNTTIPLSTAGSHYFICPSPNHCSLGMKLAINVSAATSPAPGASPPFTTPTPPAASSPTPAASSPTKSSPTPSPPSTSPSSDTPSTVPSTSTPPTSTKSTPTSDSGAAGSSIKQIDALLLGASLVLAPLLVLVG